ncbi:TVP38/TMEM64 family protein [Candidatus Woesearchaeota archaeon]|jgi:uncharacterized membrane protein YdjX (TVP38/TMEM64 family)|nr:TVP38/TMEM64 family protein [Candidatus Woesearchaeota archaeon]MBT4368658.1 TVP38/TMEM64 family protein [Candidatus Woesearchaeota archaeon]MBT4712213.1 TVP38/TMEM64 family protein [Candidatus Woesearchaeota archaeon]MBT6638955.1 TVP38/TMEM64 family protein [Candidatus Woesearchaeota archaeon]MBT7134143.1 TVP38/TMEM64 family protein [Candidatus Woesearchaeota archaeon]
MHKKKLIKIIKQMSAPLYAALLIFIIFIIIKNDIERIISIDALRDLIGSTGAYAILLFLGIFLLFTFFEFIPTFLLMILSGFLFGTLKGAFYSLTGLLIGSLLLFMIVKKFNNKFVKEKGKLNDLKYLNKLMKKDAVYAIYVARLIPIFPNELIVISAALAKLKLKEFFLIMLIGALPTVFIAAALGDSFTNPVFNLALIVFAFAGSVILSIFLFKDKLKALFVHKTIKV